MAIEPMKPWRSFEDQLDKLIKNGLEVTNRNRALFYLERLGYYRLSGYWYPLRAFAERTTDTKAKPQRLSHFAADSHFDDVIVLYNFDKKLRLLAIDALERIEMALRVDIAYVLGAYDPLAHKKAWFLDGRFTRTLKAKGPDRGKTEHQVWLAKHDALLRRSARVPCIKHNIEKYGEPPIWVAIEVWDFGQMSKLFAGMKKVDQNSIARKYAVTNGGEFASWLRSLNYIRNASAHHNRLWNINVLERSSLPITKISWHQLNNYQPFLYFCIMQHLLRTICPNSSWGQRFKSLLESGFPNSTKGQLTLNDFGVLPGWQDWELWKD